MVYAGFVASALEFGVQGCFRVEGWLEASGLYCAVFQLEDFPDCLRWADRKALQLSAARCISG